MRAALSRKDMQLSNLSDGLLLIFAKVTKQDTQREQNSQHTTIHLKRVALVWWEGAGTFRYLGIVGVPNTCFL